MAESKRKQGGKDADVSLSRDELSNLLKEAVREGFRAAQEDSSLEKAGARVGIGANQICDTHLVYKAAGFCKVCARTAGEYRANKPTEKEPNTNLSGEPVERSHAFNLDIPQEGPSDE